MKKLLVLAAVMMSFAAQAYWSPLGISIFTPVSLPVQSWNVYGVRLNAIYGRNGTVGGIDAGLVNHACGNQYGLQASPALNLVRGRAYGLQLAGVNIAIHEGYGLQFGLYNRCGDVFHGLQLGFINSAYDMRGVQIGLVNLIQASELSFCPLINANF